MKVRQPEGAAPWPDTKKEPKSIRPCTFIPIFEEGTRAASSAPFCLHDKPTNGCQACGSRSSLRCGLCQTHVAGTQCLLPGSAHNKSSFIKAKMVESSSSKALAISSGERPFWSFFGFDFLRGEICLLPVRADVPLPGLLFYPTHVLPKPA